MLVCEGRCNTPVHADRHCVQGFTRAVGNGTNGWLCGECDDQPADSEGHESEEEEASVVAGA